MNLPEDRHPLLYVYVDVDHEQPGKFRSRCISRGASALLGKWPDHLTFSWMLGVVGLFSLLTCFLLVLIVLAMASSGHHFAKRSLIEKCERNAHVVQFVHMKNLEDLTVNENATYFVEVYVNETEANESLCSVESFLRQTSSPVFLVLIFLNVSDENSVNTKELEKTYKNFVTITFDLNSFFNKTLFANYQANDPKFLSFLAKVLVSWNVGGTVVDSKLRSLRDFTTVYGSNDKQVLIGTFQDEVVLISAKKFCHAYVFDVLKTIAETRNILKYTQVQVVEIAKKRFCRKKWNCSGVKLLSSSLFCSSDENDDGCTFLMPYSSETKTAGSIRYDRERVCPTVGSFP